VLGLHARVDRIVNRFDLPVGATRADHEEVGESGDLSQIQLNDVERLAIRRKRSDRASGFLGIQRYSPLSAI
jgi:hypothetical protein